MRISPLVEVVRHISDDLPQFGVARAAASQAELFKKGFADIEVNCRFWSTEAALLVCVR